MGYRNYIASLPRVEYDEIKNYTKDELFKYKNKSTEKNEFGEVEGYISVYDIAYNQLYELGKYVDEFDSELFKPFFIRKEMQDEYTEENDFYIVEPKFLEAVIDLYSGYVKKYYNKMCMPFFGERYDSSDFLNSVKKEYNSESDMDDDFIFNHTFDFSKITQKESNALYSMLEHIRTMRTEWTQLTPYNLENGDEVTTSWKYEYAIFELVRIYKNFDWENNVMVYYGY